MGRQEVIPVTVKRHKEQASEVVCWLAHDTSVKDFSENDYRGLKNF